MEEIKKELEEIKKELKDEMLDAVNGGSYATDHDKDKCYHDTDKTKDSAHVTCEDPPLQWFLYR